MARTDKELVVELTTVLRDMTELMNEILGADPNVFGVQDQYDQATDVVCAAEVLLDEIDKGR